MGLRLNVALAVGLLLAAPAAASLYDEPRVVEVVAIVALVGIVGGLGAQHEALLIRQMRFAALRTVDLASLAVGMSAGIALAAPGAGYRALVWQSLFAALVRTIALWRVCEWRPEAAARCRSAQVASLASFGWYHTGARPLRHVSQNTDQVVVGYLFGARQLGFYDSAYRWSISVTRQTYTPLGQTMAALGAAVPRTVHRRALHRCTAAASMLHREMG